MESMPKQKVTVTIEKRLLEWVDGQIKTFRFRNRSHALEYALAKLMTNERKVSHTRTIQRAGEQELDRQKDEDSP